MILKLNEVFKKMSSRDYIVVKNVHRLPQTEPMGDGDDGGYGEFYEFIDVLVIGLGSFEKEMEFG